MFSSTESLYHKYSFNKTPAGGCYKGELCGMGIYSDRQIKQAIQSGHIVCVPFVENHVGPASLDITLGQYYYQAGLPNGHVTFNPFDKRDVERYFDGPFEALPHSKIAALYGIKPLVGISLDHPVIPLGPGEQILAHSHEFVGVPARTPCVAELKGRTSWARSGVTVSLDAGWVSPGFTGRLTLTIQNLNPKTILLPVGERIAQLAFYDMKGGAGEVGRAYGTLHDGTADKYQVGNDLETIIKTWSPSLMLPQIYTDQRELPTKIEGLSYE